MDTFPNVVREVEETGEAEEEEKDDFLIYSRKISSPDLPSSIAKLSTLGGTMEGVDVSDRSEVGLVTPSPTSGGSEGGWTWREVVRESEIINLSYL